jgi:hypothetical protein
VSLALGGMLVSVALGSPARLITVGPIIPGPNPLTGPPINPTASSGQWFLDPATGVQQVRPWEFHDNVDSAAQSSLAIQGHMTNLVFQSGVGTPMTAFSIDATITNDLPGPPGIVGQPGRNTHLETHFGGASFQGTMFNVKMTAEFAFPSKVTVPAAVLAQIAANSAPYTAPLYGGQPAAIIASNEDEEGWYCFSNTDGNYFVPTFDFGNIAPGASASRTLNFFFPSSNPLLPTHPLYGQIIAWATGGTDVLMNRTTDLKIGDWVDVLAADNAAYPVPATRAGNVSVFFNVPEPTIGMLAPLATLALRRRRTS